MGRHGTRKILRDSLSIIVHPHIARHDLCRRRGLHGDFDHRTKRAAAGSREVPPPFAPTRIRNPFISLLQSNDKLMPNSCLGQNLLVNHHGTAASRNSCLSHAQILKTPWNRVCMKRMFPHSGKSNVRKNPSTVAFYRSCTLQWIVAHLMNLPNFEYWKVVNFHCYVNVPDITVTSNTPMHSALGVCMTCGAQKLRYSPAGLQILLSSRGRGKKTNSWREHKSKANNSPCLTTLTNKETSKRFKKPFRNSRNAILAPWGWLAAPG